MFLAGKTALITGGGRGIGRAVATHLAAHGARVVVAGRTVAELEETAHAVDGLALRMDAADRASVQAALDELATRAGRVDILINNAGVAESAPLDRTTDAMWDWMMAVNVTSAFSLCRALVPPMIAAGWGRVVNLASNAGLTGYAYSSAYCASKHAMIGMTRALAVEIARSSVTVNAVCPGWVNTAMADAAVRRIAEKTGKGEEQARRALEGMSPQRRLVEPDEVAHVVGMLCSDQARSIHGQSIPVDGGQVMS